MADGERFVIAWLGSALVWEFWCIGKKRPESLITRVVYRWRGRSPALVGGVIVYFAGHFLEVWKNDPLSAEVLTRWKGWLRHEFMGLD